jgi:serine protease Do
MHEAIIHKREKEDTMQRMWNYKVGLITGLLGLGLIGMWSGDHIFAPRVSAATTAVVTAPAGAPAATTMPGFVGVAKAITPAVVNITPAQATRTKGHRDMRDQMEEFFGFPFGPNGPSMPREPREHRGGGMGSGVILSPDGYIVTNNHVVDGATEVTVTLPDKREFTGKIVGTDPKTDLAVVKIEGTNLPSATWGDAATLQVGEYVLAVGNPFGLNSTVTLGIVSALGRGRMGITQYEDFIQTDAAINPGNSGGALVNASGELVGINTAIYSQSGGNQGVGFAVPSSMAKPVVDSLIKTGKVVRGYLGIGIQEVTPDLAKAFDLTKSAGALVSDVVENGPADQAGLKQGDVVTDFNGQPVNDPADLQRKVARSMVGAKAPLQIVRDGKPVTLTVTVGEQTDSSRVAKADRGGDGSVLAGVDVQSLDRETAKELGVKGAAQGVVVTSVEPDSRAERAGLQRGDVIREINRQPIRSVKDYEQIGSSLKKDQNALLLIERRGASLFLSVKI